MPSSDDMWTFSQKVPRSLRSGDRFAGRFEILGELGRGGMGVVYRARLLSNGTEVALKIPHGDLPPRALKRMRREAEVTAALNDPGIVRLLEAGEQDGTPYLVNELVNGEALSLEFLRDLPIERAVGHLAAAARAVGAAHRQAVVHRDLKPANFILDEGGRLRVTDFGLAWIHDRKRLTETGELAGTPRYMAPEQVSTQLTIGPPADVWALGVILFELITGASPFQASTVAATVTRIISAEPEPWGAFAKRSARGIEALCRRCLEKNPDRRFPDGLALADALEARISEGLNRPPSRGRWPILLALGIAAFALLGFLAWSLLR